MLVLMFAHLCLPALHTFALCDSCNSNIYATFTQPFQTV